MGRDSALRGAGRMVSVRNELERWVDDHRDEIITETQAILRIPSVEDKGTAGPGKPFGKAIANALQHTLRLCDRLGMHTENFGGYAGHAEFGEGDEIAAMLGHLDVVPAGSGWKYDPWGATIADGWIYGRGTADDKGPTYAALFGAKAVLDLSREKGVRLSRRIRLIFGCDEESGWQCMAHYFGAAGQPKPTVAFTPDAYFPLIYAEKGSFTAIIERDVFHAPGPPVVLTAFESGLRANMVPDEARATLGGVTERVTAAEAALQSIPGITVERNGILSVHAAGKAAHGSRPEKGENAGVKLMNALVAANVLSLPETEWLTDLARRGAPDGSEVGIAGKDEVTGPLTCNLGVMEYANGVVRATFNVRYPATWDGEETIGKFRASVEATGWRVAEYHHTPPLYVPKDREPVKTLLRVYREHTGDMQDPLTIGGRTYATSVAPVGVAFGAALPGEPDVAHQADERFSVERLILCAKIYAHALYEMAK
jgi:succinyl-diaminopimelate desuccinylase